MQVEWVERINDIYGVDCALIVDLDGLVISEAGKASAQIAPHSALMVVQLMEKIGVDTMDEWRWTQCETDDIIIVVSYVYIGILVVMMQPDTNLSKVRIETVNLRRILSKKFKRPFALYYE